MHGRGKQNAQHTEGTATLLTGTPCRPTTAALLHPPLSRPTCWVRNSSLETDSTAVGPLMEGHSTCGLWSRPPCSDAAHQERRLALLWTLTVAVVFMLLP